MADEKKTVIIDLKFDVSDFTQTAAKLNKEISDLNKQQAELKKQGQEGSIEYQKNSEALRENRKELAEVNKTISNLTTANKANAGSNEQLKAQLSIMTLEYNKLSKEQRENTARGKELFTQINQTTEALKKNESAVGDNRRNVGNYEGALANAAGGLQQFRGATGGAASAVTSLSTKLLALLANPIVAIVAGIVAAFSALRKAFLANEEGQNKLAKVTQLISTIFGKLFDLIRPLADFLFDTLVKAFEYVGKEVEKTAKLIEASLRFLGFEDAANGVANYTKELDTAARAAAAISEAREKADKRERIAIVENAKADARIAEARRIAADRENYTREEREKAIKEAIRLEDEVASRQEQIAKLRFQALKAENAQSSSNKEALKELADSEAELFRIQQSRAEGQKTLLRELNKLQKEEDAEAKEIAKNRADEAKERQAAHQEKLKQIEEERKEQERLFQEVIKREVDAQQQLDEIAIKNIKDKRERELAELDASFEAKQAAIVGDGEKQKELELQLLAEQTKAKNELLQQYKNEDDEKKAVERQMELELQEILAENELASLIELEKAKADAKIAEIQRVAAINQSSEIETALAIAKVEKEKTNNIKGYEKQLTDIKKSENKARLESTMIVLEAVNSLALGSTKAAKGVALAQLAISTGKSIASIVEMSTAAGSAAGTAAGVVTAGVGAAPAFTAMKTLTYLTALGQIMGNFAEAKNIINQGKAAKGGIFGGKSHSEGGTKGYFDDGTQIEVERGELFAVVNKRNTSMLNYLNGLNTFGGNGKSFFERGGISKFADGGIGYANVSKGIEQSQQTMNGIVDIIRNMPNPVVVVQDINNVQSDVQTVEVISQI